MLFFSSVLAMVGMEVWAKARQRERETELLFIGEQYRQALRHYYATSVAGQARDLPTRLEDLLNDNRFPVPVQHLRRLYPDPITGSDEWGLIRRGDHIVGVHSLSEATPIKQAGFSKPNASFEGRTAYKDWVFLYVPTLPRR
jgi:type II secretory pathway pseudopilin PulG